MKVSRLSASILISWILYPILCLAMKKANSDSIYSSRTHRRSHTSMSEDDCAKLLSYSENEASTSARKPRKILSLPKINTLMNAHDMLWVEQANSRPSAGAIWTSNVNRIPANAKASTCRARFVFISTPNVNRIAKVSKTSKRKANFVLISAPIVISTSKDTKTSICGKTFRIESTARSCRLVALQL
uniref:AlNc14C34G3087 protein n=1 Tax=Albugo laibachii Nc14 TaxID=890382 RepID=F0W8F7_9STRA|nr:AlNc14C34G3087 [Albugo laibachii Nc14]|eukprot:CCA17412.1 AlNc14C34G3087 [Albugo laibachii Nc14]